jgi:hypothetical protein
LTSSGGSIGDHKQSVKGKLRLSESTVCQPASRQIPCFLKIRRQTQEK